MNLHYSIYKTIHEDSDYAYIDLSAVVRVKSEIIDDCPHVTIQGREWDSYLEPSELPQFLAAWNRYKYAAAASHLIKIPEIQNPTIACNSAFRIDEFLGFLAGEKLKELQAIEQD